MLYPQYFIDLKHSFDLIRRRLAVWFLPHVCMQLIFLWSQISEVSDYLSIKHIHCPAINALIAAETEIVPVFF